MDVVKAANPGGRRVLPFFSHMTGQTRLGQVPGEELGKDVPKPVNGPEYDAFEVGDFISDWVANSMVELTGPLVDLTKVWLPDERYPFLTGPYGKTLRKRGVYFGVNVASELAAGPLANLVRAIVHRVKPQSANEPEPGFGLHVAPANRLAAQLVKTIATGMANTWLVQAYTPPPLPPPPPPPPPKPGDPPPPAPPAKHGPTFLGKDLKDIAHSTAMFGVSLLISKAYDQTVGPVVQRAINTVMGRSKEEVPKPAPINPGSLASTLGSVFLSGLIMRPVEWKSLPAKPLAITGPAGVGAGPAPTVGAGTGGALSAMGGVGPLVSQALMNGLISSAFDTVYERSVGPAIADTVNGWVGIEPVKREPQPATGERLVRTFARSGVAATAYYLADALTQPFFLSLAGRLGGGLGAFVAMAGASLLGMTAATATDALVGDSVGSAAGSIWSWVTGDPKLEDRPPPEPAKAPEAAPAPK